MTTDVVRNQLRDIFRKVAPEVDFDSIDLKRPLRDQVEIDSLDFYNILVHLHKATGVNIPDSAVMQMPSLESLIHYVAKKTLENKDY